MKVAEEEVEHFVVSECGPRGWEGCCPTGRSGPADRDAAAART
jgi:hypothetical protein